MKQRSIRFCYYWFKMSGCLSFFLVDAVLKQGDPCVCHPGRISNTTKQSRIEKFQCNDDALTKEILCFRVPSGVCHSFGRYMARKIADTA